jgi:hypothetical protein
MFQPRLGFACDIFKNEKSVLRGSWGIYNARQNMLTQVGAITTNGVQQQSIFASSCVNPPACNFFNTATGGPPPTYPNTVTIPPLAPGTFPFQPGVTVFSKDYANPRVYTVNGQFEQQIAPSWSAYIDLTWSKGVHLTRFEDPNSAGTGAVMPTSASDTFTYLNPLTIFPNLGALTNTTSDARSLYRGATIGVRKRMSNRFQLEANYTWSEDLDDDSNERDPFTFRYADLFNLAKEYSYSDRDEKHKFSLYTYVNLPWKIVGNVRMQAHSAQPVTDLPSSTGTPSGAPCTINNSQTRFVVVSPGVTVDCGRNHIRKDNAYFTFDWRLERGFMLGERFTLTPTVEMFNTFNNKNNINTLSSPLLFDFNGFLREGVGDPREAQLALRLSW